MVTISLFDREVAVLKHALEYYVSELRMEVSHTDRKEYRDQLKIEEEILKEFVRQLASEN